MEERDRDAPEYGVLTDIISESDANSFEYENDGDAYTVEIEDRDG